MVDLEFLVMVIVFSLFEELRSFVWSVGEWERTREIEVSTLSGLRKF